MQKTRIIAIRLRDVTHDDLPKIYEMQLDLESNRLAVTIPRSADAFDALWSKVLQDPNVTAKVILVDEVLVGHISCFKLDGLDSVGYWIDKAFWGKGIATQALQLLLKEATARPLYAQVATSRMRSSRSASILRRTAALFIPGGRGHPCKHLYTDFVQPIHCSGG